MSDIYARLLDLLPGGGFGNDSGDEMKPQRPPRNINDLSQCIKFRDGILYIFCVECDDWRQVAVLGRANVLKSKRGVEVLDFDEPVTICRACRCDVGYLLTEAKHKSYIKLLEEQ